MDRADLLAEQLGLPIRDRRLLAQALTHTSWLHEHPGEAAGHNERLEFLGDAVVNLAVSEALYTRHPDDDEGVLSARRAAIVSATGLATLASRIDLGTFLSLGEGEAGRIGPGRPSIMASAFEALLGALLLDIGWDLTRDWVIGTAAPEIDAGLPPASLKSPKSRLQEETQRTTGGRPSYRVLEAVGPDHDKLFRVQVSVGGDMAFAVRDDQFISGLNSNVLGVGARVGESGFGQIARFARRKIELLIPELERSAQTPKPFVWKLFGNLISSRVKGFQTIKT